MRAEVAKIRALPTPRWTTIVVFGLLAIAFVALFLWGGDNHQDYEDTVEALVGVTNIAAIVIGVWMAGLEYGQSTLRRTLTADPRRGRLLASKLAVGIGFVTALTVAALLAAAVFFSIAASAHDAGSAAGDAFDLLAGAIVANAFYAALGLGIALLTQSMAGGMTAMLALIFVVDGILGGISGVEDWTFGPAVTDVTDAINNTGDDVPVGHSSAVLVLWLTVTLGAGWSRFTGSDVK